MLERILHLLKTRGLSSTQFADKVGVQRSSISHVLSGRNKPSLDFITKILLAFPDVNPDWLLMGNGEMIRDTITKITDTDTETSGLFDAEAFHSDSEPSGSAKTAEKAQQQTDDHKKAGKQKSISGDGSIERVVIFYKDGTFSNYSPND